MSCVLCLSFSTLSYRKRKFDDAGVELRLECEGEILLFRIRLWQGQEQGTSYPTHFSHTQWVAT